MEDKTNNNMNEQQFAAAHRECVSWCIDHIEGLEYDGYGMRSVHDGVENRLARVIEALESELVGETREARGAQQYCSACNGYWRTCCGVGGQCGCTRYKSTSAPQCYQGANPCFS